MSISLITGSIKTINGLLSAPNAAQLQLPNTLQREDDSGTYTQSSGNASFTVVDSSMYNIGDIVYFKNEHEEGAYTVESLPTSTLIRTTALYVAPSGAVGPLNNITQRPNYELNIQILDPVTFLPLVDTILKYTPRPDGSIFVDLGGVMVEYMEFSGLNSQEYIYKYWESWTDGPAPVELFSDTPQAVLAYKQQFQEGGANMWRYLLRIGGTDIDNLYYPNGKVFNELEIPLGAIDWDVNTADNLEVTLSPVLGLTAKTLYLGELDKSKQTKLGTLANGRMEVLYEVTNFISAGTLRLDFYGIRRDGASGNVWGNLALSVVGNTAPIYGGFNITDVEAVNDDFIAIGWRPSMSGDYTANVKVNTLDGHFLRWESYPVAKLLTKFKNPLTWRGWGRSVSFLIDTNLVSRGVVMDIRQIQSARDVNKGFIVGVSTGIISTNNATPDIWTFPILEHIDAFYMSFMLQDNLYIDISEELFYRVLKECQTPIAVQWLNSLGAPEMHLFTGRQNVNDTADEGTQYRTPVSWDLSEENRRTKGRLNVDSRQQILLTATGLTLDQLEAISEIKESGFVSLYLTKDGTELLPVIVVTDFTTEHETDGGHFEFSVLVELPEGVKFNTVKKY